MTPEAVVQKIAYVLANPVTAGLVRHADEWPGAKVRVDDLGSGVLRARRPDVYFDATNPEWPEEAEFPVTLPPGIEEGDAEAFRREVAAEVTAEEVRTSTEMQRRGVPFLGASRALGVSPHERAISFEELRKRNPTFAVGRRNEGEGVWQRAAAGVRAFRAAYRNALEQWCAGVRSVVFPAGTWWMRVLHAVEISHVALAG
jgi:putative transposase